MKILLSWLKEFADWEGSHEELAHRLTMAGFEVESIEKFNPEFEKVVVAKILEIKPHPNADRLSLCQVTTGGEANLAIVCGAKNISPEDVVPLALDGATLPGGKTITASKIRGEFSQGMLCSGNELGLGEDTKGIWLLPKDLPLGADVKEALRMNDTAFELNVTPNRPDALSIRGVAREVAALQGKKSKIPERKIQESTESISGKVQIKVEDYEACPHYMARLIRNVKIGPSPLWLKQRLERSGHRSINNVVDITNLILLELGHPLHAFDFDQIQNSEVVIRKAHEGEKFITLDNQELTLQSSMLVIADSKRAIALGGVMGGKNTEVTEQTKNILLECAYFQPSGIRRTAKATGLASESSYRFERGIDPLGLPEALDHAAALIQALAGGEVLKGVIDLCEKMPAAKIVSFRPERCRKVLGTGVTDSDIQKVFDRLSFKVDHSNAAQWKVEAPTYRPDLAAEIDLIEEVARLSGYDHIVEAAPNIKPKWGGKPYSRQALARDKVRRFLQGVGLNEAINYGFISTDLLKKARQSTDAIPLLNPVRQDLSHMRTSLIPYLLTNTALNLNHGNSDVALFEIGTSFQPPRHETETLGMVMAGKTEGLDWMGGRRAVDFASLKGLIQSLFAALKISSIKIVQGKHPSFHPGQCAQVLLKDVSLGYLGQIHPDAAKEFDLKEAVYAAELNLEALANALSEITFHEIPKYPSVSRDVAILVDREISHQMLEEALWKTAPNILEEVKLFDVFEGGSLPADKKSMAYSLTFRSLEATLKVEEVDARLAEMKEKLSAELKCQFR
jgi:phenylalanyl-tRNA synthetase beta chain